MTRIAQDLLNKVLDFYWKKKWKIVRSARRRGFDCKILPRIPTVAITGSVGKTTTCRMVSHILARTGLRVGLSTTHGLYVGKEEIRSGVQTGGEPAGRLLADPRVRVGVFELPRGGLIKNGTIIDAFEVGAVLNVYDNHIGLDGVADREGLARVKQEVVQRALKLAVLNADDSLCLGMRPQIKAPRLCLVSVSADNPEVLAHLAQGGMAAVLEEQSGKSVLRVQEGATLIGSLDATAIPATHGGLLRPPMINALFAAAIAHGLGIGWNSIRGALECFHSTLETNPGRMNYYPGFPFELLVTWAEGPQALTELARFVGLRGCSGRRHLVFFAMGNRPDWFCQDMARSVAGAFDTYVCSDWEDLRGRPPEEIAHVLADGLRENGVPDENISVASSYAQALEMAFRMQRPGDLLVVVTFGDATVRETARRFQEEMAVGHGKGQDMKGLAV